MALKDGEKSKGGFIRREYSMEKKIREYFRNNKLPKPGAINYIGKWAMGECYAVTCGIIFLKRYVVYCSDNKILRVRQRMV